MFGLDRSRRAGRYLEWKVRIFTVGAVLAVVGMYREEEWMTGAAIVVLLTGFVLRFLPGMEPQEEPAEGDVESSGSDAALPSGPPVDDGGP